MAPHADGVDEAARRAEHYRSRLGLGSPGMPAELEQLQRARNRLDIMTDAELTELALRCATRSGPVPTNC